MAFNFPDSPTTNQTFQPPGGPTYTWNGSAWIMSAGAATVLGFTTGDLKPTHKTVADVGWILWKDGTIGGATSNATLRANVDTQALFTMYYNGYDDATCPITTSTGTATTRAGQGSAATAFAAGVRMTLPKSEGRLLGMAGAGTGLTSRAIGAATGAETHTQTAGEMVSHNHGASSSDSGHLHGLTNNYAVITGIVMDVSAVGGGAGYSASPSNDAVTPINYAAITTSIGFNGGSTPMNIMNPSSFINVMIKL